MGSGIGPSAGGMAETDLGLVTDGARNPVCGLNPKPAICFTENRATLHLHGGITPWISDGTPHQWITPAGESRPTLIPTGRQRQQRPRHARPGPRGADVLLHQPAERRLMFYHDHAWGITRLNVYAGEAAGYVLTDATEQALIGYRRSP